MELSVVLPCFNEAANVERAVEEAHEAARAIASRFEVVVVDDGSHDDTVACVLRVQARFPEVRLVRHPSNRGYGAALRSGFRAARYPWVFYTDGDAQFDSRQLADLAEHIGRADVLAGYRSPRRDGSWARSVLGRAWTQLTNTALGLDVRDMNCAFKVFPKVLLDAIPMHSEGATIDAEILVEARRHGLSIREFPVTHRPRVHGSATGARPSVALRAVWDLGWLVARLHLRPTDASLAEAVKTQGQTRLRPVRFAS